MSGWPNLKRGELERLSCVEVTQGGGGGCPEVIVTFDVADFDTFVEAQCAPFYADGIERPSLAPGRVTTSGAPDPDPEVPATVQRRRFSAEYRLRILQQADACKKPGEVGALLRREELYSSLLTNWRRRREAGAQREMRGRQSRTSAVSSGFATRRSLSASTSTGCPRRARKRASIDSMTVQPAATYPQPGH